MADLYKLGDKVLTAVKQGLQISPPKLKYEWIDLATEDGADLAADKYENRTIVLPLKVSADSTDELIAEVNAIIAEAIKDTNILEWKPHGATDSIYFDTFKADVDIPYDWVKTPHGVMEMTLIIPAKPFGYGDEVEYPINYVQDGSLNLDNNNDGVANSWALDADAGITYTVDINDGGQQIDVTGGTATGSIEIEQTLTGLAVGDVLSMRGDWRSSGYVNVMYYVQLQFIGSGAAHKSLCGGAAWQEEWADVEELNFTVPAGTTSVRAVIRIAVTTIGGTGTIWLKNFLVRKSTTAPSFYESRVTPPAEIFFFDILGDVSCKPQIFLTPAMGLNQFKMARRTTETATDLIIGCEDFNLDNGTITTDTTCRDHQKISHTPGAVAADVIHLHFDSTKNYEGRFRVFAKAYDANTVVGENKFRIETKDGNSPWMNVDEVLGWRLVDFGEFILSPDAPSGYNWDSTDIIIQLADYTTDGTPSALYWDFFAIMPVNECMLETSLGVSPMTLIDGYEGDFWQLDLNSQIQYLRSNLWVGNDFKFDPGTNKIILASTDTDTSVDRTLEVRAKYKPQYLLAR